MAKDGGGAIVNTASMAAHSGPSNMIAYGTSKAAWLHTKLLTKSGSSPNMMN